MPVSPKPISPELLAEARRLYERTRTPLDDIAALLGIGTLALSALVRKEGWRRRIGRISPTPPEQMLAAGDEDDSPDAADAAVPPMAWTERATVAVRVMRAVERQLAAVERIVGKLSAAPEHVEQAERAARSLASLSRTLSELKTIMAVAEPKSDHDDAVPADLDELRRELSARLDRIVAGTEGQVSRHPEDRNRN